jgi:hypothetical protein
MIKSLDEILWSGVYTITINKDTFFAQSGIKYLTCEMIQTTNENRNNVVFTTELSVDELEEIYGENWLDTADDNEFICVEQKDLDNESITIEYYKYGKV